MREWTKNVERCARRVHPKCTIDRFGRMVGITQTGVISLNSDPYGIPNTIIPSNREYYYLWFNNPLGTRFYPITAQAYSLRRLEGENPANMLGCTP